MRFHTHGPETFVRSKNFEYCAPKQWPPRSVMVFSQPRSLSWWKLLRLWNPGLMCPGSGGGAEAAGADGAVHAPAPEPPSVILSQHALSPHTRKPRGGLGCIQGPWVGRIQGRIWARAARSPPPTKHFWNLPVQRKRSLDQILDLPIPGFRSASH